MRKLKRADLERAGLVHIRALDIGPSENTNPMCLKFVPERNYLSSWHGRVSFKFHIQPLVKFHSMGLRSPKRMAEANVEEITCMHHQLLYF
jgi:hypothetical protein